MQQGDQALLVRMQEAVVPRPPEALGQDVLQQQVEELGTGQRADLALPALAVAVAEADLAAAVVIASEEVGLADHAAIEVTTQINEGLLAVADTLAVDHPFPRQRLGRMEASLRERRQQLGAKHLRERLVAEEIAALRAPASAPRIQARAGHDQMHVWMQVEPARVGVQHRHRPGLALELAVVAAEGLHRAPGGGEESAVDALRVPCGQCTQLSGQGEGEQEILGGYLQAPLALEPLFALVMLAVRTEPVPARVRDEPLLGALGASREQLRGHAAAATQHCPQRLGAFWAQGVAVAGAVVGLEALDDLRERDHRTVPQSRVKCCIRASMRVRADSVVWLVRWV